MHWAQHYIKTVAEEKTSLKNRLRALDRLGLLVIKHARSEPKVVTCIINFLFQQVTGARDQFSEAVIDMLIEFCGHPLYEAWLKQRLALEMEQLRESAKPEVLRFLQQKYEQALEILAIPADDRALEACTRLMPHREDFIRKEALCLLQNVTLSEDNQEKIQGFIPRFIEFLKKEENTQLRKMSIDILTIWANNTELQKTIVTCMAAGAAGGLALAFRGAAPSPSSIATLRASP